MRYTKFFYKFLCVGLLLALLLNLAGCGSKRETKETEETTYGVDVSRYQGTIDWQEVAASGIDFAIVRVGYRDMTEGEIHEERNGRYNLQEANKAGVKLGAYFFSTAVTEEEAIEEARWAADLLDGYPMTYPVAYDCEGFSDPESRQYSLTKEERTDIALAFLKTIEKLGYEGMFYGSKNELENDAQWETSRIAKKYKIWVAQYPGTDFNSEGFQSSYSDGHHIWQYTQEGTVPGISQPVDLNIAYFGYDGVESAKSEVPPQEVEPDVEVLMNFTQVDEQVTAKESTNLRSAPSQGEDSQVLYTLQNGEVAQRIGISSSGWSKLIYQGETYYAVSSYLTTDLDGTGEEETTEFSDPDGDGIQTEFTEVNEEVTAKDVVNLRKLPSVEHEDAEIVGQLNRGDVATRVGISDNGWSKLEYNGMTCYAVSSYLERTDEVEQTQATGEDYVIQTQFVEVNEQVTPKEEVNLRTLPSVEHPDSQVVATIYSGDIVTRTGINEDVGWSRVEYNGQTLYCVSSYIQLAQ